MTETSQNQSPTAVILCTTCGLCCTGHLFARANLITEEVGPTEALGFSVIGGNSEHPSFQLPCHLWVKKCTIYEHPHKPEVCSGYKCKILKAIEAEEVDLDAALSWAQKAKKMITEIDALLPALPEPSFRERLVGYVNGLENKRQNSSDNAKLRLKTGVLMVFFTNHFGVEHLFEGPGTMKSGDETA